MQKTKKRDSRINSKSRPNRAFVDSRKKRGNANENKKRQQSFTGLNGTGLHILSKQLKPLTYLELQLRGVKKEYNSPDKQLKIYDTEAKQIQIIKDLYEIVKAQQEYKVLKEPVLNEDTDPIDVIKWLLRKISPLTNMAKGNDWVIDTYEDESGKTRYRLVIRKNYNSQKVLNECYLGIDFLPLLKTKDEQLHDLVVDTIALVSKVNGVKMWYELKQWQECKETFCMYNPSLDYWTMEDIIPMVEKKETKQFISYDYQFGIAAHYQKLFEQRKEVVTIQSVTKMQARYEGDSIRKRLELHWVTGALTMATLGGNIDNNTFVPNYVLSDKTVLPNQSYVFMWCNRKNDPLTEMFYKALISNGEKHGEYIPVKFSITKPGEKITLPKECSHPERLVEFMKHKGSILNAYRDYYYGTELQWKTLLHQTATEFFIIHSNKKKQHAKRTNQ